MSTAARVRDVGLVVVLDHTGRTIAALEDRVDELEAALAAERDVRRRLELLLGDARRAAEQPDTRHLAPPGQGRTDTRPHATDPARPNTE